MDRLACLASRLDKMMFFLACLATQAGAAERWLLHGGYTGYGGTEEYGEGLAKAQVGLSSSPDRPPASQLSANHPSGGVTLPEPVPVLGGLGQVVPQEPHTSSSTT